MAIGILKSNINTGIDSEIMAELVAPINITSNQPAFVGDLLSLRQNITTQNVQRWELTGTVRPANNASSANFLIHSVTSGLNRKVYLRMPQIYRGESKLNYNTITVSVPAIKNANTLALQGNGAKNIQPGEFFNLDSHGKLYMVTDVSNDGATVVITPPLRMAVNIGTEVKYGPKATLTARYNTDSILGIKYTDGVLSEPGAYTFIEAV